MALVVCSASTKHTGLCHSPSHPNIPKSAAMVSNCMCKSGVLFKTLFNFWRRWGFLLAVACRRAGLESQSCPGSPSLLLSTHGAGMALLGPCTAWCLPYLPCKLPGLPANPWSAHLKMRSSIMPAQLGKRQHGNRSKPQTSIPTRNQQLCTS